MSNFMVLIISILVTILLVGRLIPLLKIRNIGQPIREEGNKEHYKKQGTPTMGGIVFLVVFFIMSILTLKINSKLLIILLSTIGFGMIGFIDDYEKIMKRQNLGLTEKQKLALQVILSFIVAFLIYYLKITDSYLDIPLLNLSLYTGILYVPIAVFIMVGTVNAVNLTDGLDGLLSSVSLPVFIGIFLMSNFVVPEVSTPSIIFTGILLGFLVYNSSPASIFMGDTGSMAIGGAFASMMFIIDKPIYIMIIGGVYLMEALSLIIQVVSYKTRNKKRVFLMSPIHHHFELKGHKESKIVASFMVLSVILTALAFVI